MHAPLNEDQKKAMMKCLADAFDYAATHAATKELAAIMIAARLQNDDYRIIKSHK
jgi:hypothetical protein